MIPAAFRTFIGIPYRDKGRDRAGCDCWGIVKLALAEMAGIALPDYSDAYTRAGDHTSVALAVESGLKDGWARVERP
jgi:cell wall-associated NlpC family hydrolase